VEDAPREKALPAIAGRADKQIFPVRWGTPDRIGANAPSDVPHFNRLHNQEMVGGQLPRTDILHRSQGEEVAATAHTIAINLHQG